MRALACAALSVLLLLGLAARSGAQTVHYRCGSFQTETGRVYVSAYGISCKLAVELQTAYFLAPEDEKELVGPDSYNGYVRLKRFPGWHCTSGAMAGACAKGKQDAAYYDGPPENTTTPCGSLRIDYTPTPGEHYGREYLSAPLSITCRKAKELLRRYEHHPRGCLGSGCYSNYSDGWACHTATPGEWPAIIGCEKGFEKVEAHVRSKSKGPR